MSRPAASEHARTYLASFLPAGRAEELARAAAEEAGPDADPSVVLAAAHRHLTHEVRVTDEVAAHVLVEEVGLTPHDAAAVLDLPGEWVVAAVAEARAIAEELGVATTRPGDGRPEPFRKRHAATIVVGLAVVVAVVLAVAMSARASDGGDPTVDDDGAVVGRATITDVRTTDEMGQEGPGSHRVELRRDGRPSVEAGSEVEAQ